MNEIGEKFLPIGTVVLLKGGKKRLIITGYCAPGAGDKEGKIFDYSGCIYPEGMMFSDAFAAFDHDKIEKVFHKGLVDEEFDEFHKKLVQISNAMTLVTPFTPGSIINNEPKE